MQQNTKTTYIMEHSRGNKTLVQALSWGKDLEYSTINVKQARQEKSTKHMHVSPDLTRLISSHSLQRPANTLRRVPPPRCQGTSFGVSMNIIRRVQSDGERRQDVQTMYCILYIMNYSNLNGYNMYVLPYYCTKMIPNIFTQTSYVTQAIQLTWSASCFSLIFTIHLSTTWNIPNSLHTILFHQSFTPLIKGYISLGTCKKA